MSRPLFGTPIAQPFRWFAWHPVRTGDRGWRWLRTVWRQRYQTKLDLSGPVHQWWHHDVRFAVDEVRAALADPGAPKR